MIKVEHQGRHLFDIAPRPGMTLAQCLFLRGAFHRRLLCSGLGKCGQCEVRFTRNAPVVHDAEMKIFGQDKTDQGWRLSCLHKAEGDGTVELPHPPGADAEKKRPNLRVDQGTVLAIDLGTTSIHWKSKNSAGQEQCGARLNPQAGLGGEVISRIAFALSAPQGAETMRRLVLEAIESIFQDLECRPASMCIAANTAMTCLLTGTNPAPLATAPYRTPLDGGFKLDILGTSTYIPPLPAPFIGADLSAGLAWMVLERKAPYPFVLADLGTNGEFILALSDKEFIAASAPMGPALEGVGLTHGMVAGPGAAVSYSLSPQGPVPQTLGHVQAKGLAGTGYLSLAALLARNGLLGPDGRFAIEQDMNRSPLTTRLANSVETVNGELAFNIGGGMWLPGSDIEEILKVKAAFNTVLSELLTYADMSPEELNALYLAGAMGQNVSVRDMVELGFIPENLAAATRPVGNTSLSGAMLLAGDRRARDWIENRAHGLVVLSPALDENFTNSFLSRMVMTYVP